MNVTINALELASELAHKELIKDWSDSIQIFEDEDADVISYTDEAQDIFNDLYDKYLEIILSCKENDKLRNN